MLQDFFFRYERFSKRKDKLHDLERERHFELLYMQSFTEMQSRSSKH